MEQAGQQKLLCAIVSEASVQKKEREERQAAKCSEDQRHFAQE